MYEKELLDKYILKLDNPSPRQIKIFYYRYLLLKLLEQSVEFSLIESLGEEYFYELAMYTLVEKQKNNLFKIVSSENNMNDDLIKILGKSVDNQDLYKLSIILEMVVPY